MSLSIMEYLIFVFSLSLAIILLFRSRKQRKNLPPSPFALPILGHLHLIKQPTHRSFHKLSQKYGPIMSLKFGSRLVILISSASAAEECFTTRDLVLANRPDTVIGKYLQHNYHILGATNYGDLWRRLRRFSNEEVFSCTTLNSCPDVRINEVKALLRRLYRISSHGFAKVTLRPMFMDLASNILMEVVAGKRYYGEEVRENEEEARYFREMVDKVYEMMAVTHPSDLFPILRKVDYDGFVKKLAGVGKRTDAMLQKMVDEHRANMDRNNMITHLLTLQETKPERCPDAVIKGLILTMMIAGTDTVAKSLEWTMTNLLNHPEVLIKAKQELDSQVGQDRLINETDLSKLHYLQCIIDESLRYTPVAPLLVAHSPSEDCTIGGYHIPRGAMLMVNVWTIQRDPKLWEDPEIFKPERFENRKSEEYRNIMFPFGRGRRICPGEELSNRQAGLVLGSLIQCFEWERVGGAKIDTTEITILTMKKAEPLALMCKARPMLQKFL